MGTLGSAVGCQTPSSQYGTGMVTQRRGGGLGSVGLDVGDWVTISKELYVEFQGSKPKGGFLG